MPEEAVPPTRSGWRNVTTVPAFSDESSHPPGTESIVQRGEGRIDLGRMGEAVAAAVLCGRGAVVVDRNASVGSGEIDLIVRFGRQRVVVEVRSTTGELGLDRRFPHSKLRQVGRLAATVGVDRVDLVGVAIHPDRVDVHWLRDVPCH